MTKNPTRGDRPKGVRAKSAGEWIPLFLKALNTWPHIWRACEESGVSRAAVYAWREKHPAFAVQMDEAKAKGEAKRILNLEQEAFNRALDSSDTLLKFLLSKYDPKTFGDRSVLDINLHMPREAVLMLFTSFVSSVRNNVRDKQTLGRIEQEFARTVKGSPLTLEGEVETTG